MTTHTARIDYECNAHEFWDAFRANSHLLDQSCELCRRCRELLDDDVTTFTSEFDYQSFVGYASSLVGWGSGPAYAKHPIVFAESTDGDTEKDESQRDHCMTRSEADAIIENWNSQKPELFVLLMRDDSGEWSETAYGETCVSSAETDMQATVNDLCKNSPDFRSAKFGYSDYPFESPFIVERLYDENDYGEE